jgi:hypothetical protein
VYRRRGENSRAELAGAFALMNQIAATCRLRSK